MGCFTSGTQSYLLIWNLSLTFFKILFCLDCKKHIRKPQPHSWRKEKSFRQCIITIFWWENHLSTTYWSLDEGCKTSSGTSSFPKPQLKPVSTHIFFHFIKQKDSFSYLGFLANIKPFTVCIFPSCFSLRLLELEIKRPGRQAVRKALS